MYSATQAFTQSAHAAPNDTPPLSIETVSEAQESALLAELIRLLQDTVAAGTPPGGPFLGFVAPVGEAEARSYWEHVFHDLRSGPRLLLIAREATRIVGSVQLLPATISSGLHRAEVQKLMVDPSQRKRGIGRTLMLAVEQTARADGRTLLVLDTRRGNVSERLYQAVGYQVAGIIPGYALGVNGATVDEVIYYKSLPHDE